MDSNPSILLLLTYEMKNFKYIIQVVILLLGIQSLYCQTWPKVYLQNTRTYPLSVIDCYDRGYLIGGWFITSDGLPINGLLIKTDCNGDILWYKRLGDYNEISGVFDVNQTNDGGFIISGATKKTDIGGDPFIMKLNACGEREWCRIYKIGQEKFEVAISIEQIPSGYVALVYNGYDIFSKENTYLYKLDQNGDMVWQQLYGQKDTLMIGTEGRDMIVTPDNHYLITGDCYYPDPDSVEPKYLRPVIIKVDSLGGAEWELPWSRVNGTSFHGEGYGSIIDNNQNIYSCGRHIESSTTPPGDRPTMLKTDSSGNEISYHDLVPDSWQAVFSDINWFKDSTIELNGAWVMTYGGESQIGVFKVDRIGNILDSTNIQKTDYCFSDAIIDKDNKLFLVQPKSEGGFYRTYAWKLNSDLEYDTLYTQPLVYDSLCPHPIASDTIPLNCIIVGIDEPFQNPETGKLRVYPNPARDKLHLVIPDQIKTRSDTPVFDLTTVYHQWHSALVEIYDLFGRRMYSKEVFQPEKEMEVDVSTWQKGMYMVRLVYNGRTVASEKVVIE